MLAAILTCSMLCMGRRVVDMLMSCCFDTDTNQLPVESQSKDMSSFSTRENEPLK